MLTEGLVCLQGLMVGSNGRERKGKQTVLRKNVPRSFTHTKVTNARKDRQGIQQEKFDQCVTCLDEGSYIFKAFLYIHICMELHHFSMQSPFHNTKILQG